MSKVPKCFDLSVKESSNEIKESNLIIKKDITEVCFSSLFVEYINL